jgi:hypothetical protein
MQAKKDRIEEEVWKVADILNTDARDGFNRDWFNSIKKFIEKLGFYEVHDAMDVAVGKIRGSESSVFRYFCGICWNKIREQEDGNG